MKLRNALGGATALLVLAACGSGTGSSGSSGSGDGGEVKPATSVVADCLPTRQYADEADQPVDSAKYKKDTPWVLGVSAASTTSSSYIVYWNQELKYAVSLDKRFSKMVEYDAGYNASKQIDDIRSLIRQGVSAILFTPSDNKAIEPALAEANAAGIPTIMGTSAFIPDPNITATVTVELFKYYAESAARLFEAMGGTGEVAMLRTIAGTTEDTIQDQAVNCVLKAYPGIKIVASEFATYGTPQAQKAAEAWAVRFPNLKGILSVYAETSIGAFNAMNAAGRANQIQFSPANVENGWLKVIQSHPSANLGGVEYPVTTSKDTVEVIAKILSGEQVPQATLLGGQYIPPDDYAAQVEPDKPDTWWPNDLPAEFLPKS